jgi:poly-beta-hydroxyalkanoate depolymerase
MSKPFIISTFSKDVSGEYFNYFADTYEEAVKLAEDFYLQTGRVVAVEKVAQGGLCSA